MIKREEVIQMLEESKKEVKALEKVLQALDRSGLEKRTGSAMRFYQVRPSTAIKILLREGGPDTQEALTQKLIDGGVIEGKKRTIHNIRLSFEKVLENGTLKKVGDLIGLPQWGPEKFKTTKLKG